MNNNPMNMDLENDVFYYTTTDNSLFPFEDDMFDAHIVEHTYEGGQGKVYFDHPITECGLYKNTWDYWNNKINSLIIPNSVRSLRDRAMYRLKNIETIVVPNSVTMIGNEAFKDCTSLVFITISNSITSIGNSAFENCTKLKEVTIPDSVIKFGSNVFYGCSSIEKFYGKFASADNCCLIINGTLDSFASAFNGDYTIPDNVITIAANAFRRCESLTGIIIPNGVTSIGYEAFYSCTSLRSIDMPNSINSIGDKAFCNCRKLIYINIPQSVTSIAGNTFDGCTSLPIVDNIQYADSFLVRSLYHSTNATIKVGTRWIGNNAFSHCFQLNSVIIPDGVLSIGDNAFEYCKNLTSVSIPNTVTHIGASVFWACQSLHSITIPDSVVSIGHCALSDMHLVIVGSNVRDISDAFIKSHVSTRTIIFRSFDKRTLGRHYEVYENARVYIPIEGAPESIDRCYPLYQCKMIYKYEPSELPSIIKSELEFIKQQR